MIIVTGATGKLGHHVISGLLEKLPASEVVVVARDPAKAKSWAELGVQVRAGDYTKPETLEAALAGADQLLLISSSEVGQRAAQHANVIEAAKKAGVKLLVYTSAPRADDTPLALATEHAATEKLIRGSGLPFVFLRNGWYLENWTENLAAPLAHGVLLGAAGEGRFAGASRSDLAAAAVAVLTTPGHAGQVYELGGDVPFTLTELAAELSAQSGKPVVYTNLPQEDFKQALIGFGLPEVFADLLADSDFAASKGALDDSSKTLSRLIGRPTTTLAEAIRAAL